METLAGILEEHNRLLAFGVERLELWALAWREPHEVSLWPGPVGYIVVVQHRKPARNGLDIEKSGQECPARRRDEDLNRSYLAARAREVIQ